MLRRPTVLQQGDPQLYAESTKHLRPEEVNIIQNICAQAEALERTAAIQAGNAAPPPQPTAPTNAGVPQA